MLNIKNIIYVHQIILILNILLYVNLFPLNLLLYKYLYNFMDVQVFINLIMKQYFHDQKILKYIYHL